MINYILLCISVALGITKNLISKAGKKAFDGLDSLLFSNIVTALLALVIFGFGGLEFSLFTDPYFIVMTVIFGLCTMLSQMLLIIAMKNGSVAICSLIYSCGFLIPTIFGTIYYREKISLVWILGIALLVAGIFAATGSIDKAKSKRWILPAVLAMTCSGAVGILQKLFRIENPQGDIDTFLFTSFLVMLVASGVAKLIVHKRGGNTVQEVAKPRYFLIASLVLAISVVFANKLNLYLSGVLPGIIFFPCVNGGCIALSGVASSLIFKERLKPVQWIGVFSSVAAIILIAV